MQSFSRRLISVALIGLVFMQSDFALAWGNEGHTYVNRVAAEKIPIDMPKFFRRAAAINEIAYLGPEPDRWRSPSEFALKNAQEPDHFIDLERVSWLDPLPQAATSSIASSTRSARRPPTILTTIFRSASVCSRTSPWKCTDA